MIDVTGAKRACRRGEILVDGVPACTTTELLPSQLVEIVARASTSQRHLEHRGGMTEEEARKLLKVVYEDEHMACVLKVSGEDQFFTASHTACLIELV